MSAPEKTNNYQYEKVPTLEGEKTKENENQEVAPYGYGVRHVQLLQLFVCLTIAFIARSHLGVTIVAMVDPATSTNVTNNETRALEELHSVNRNESSLVIIGVNGDNDSYVESNRGNLTTVYDTENIWNVYRTYKWPKSTQEMVLSSFFLGYLVMMSPMGWVCQRWGGKLPLQICLSINGLVSILTPWVVAWGGWAALCACRVAQGLSQAGTYPAAMTLVAVWVPPRERASLSTYVFTGTVVGTVAGFQMGGLLAASSWGWPATFWWSGALCLLACALITMWGAATPRHHARITLAERTYILGHADTGPVTKRATPWKAILRSRRVWAVIATNVGSGTTFYFLLTQVSSYLHYVLGVNIRKSGLLSSLPYIAGFFSSLVMGYMSDYLTNKNIISIKHARMLFNTISGAGMAVCIAAVSFVQSPTPAVLVLVLGMVAQAGVHTGWMVNYIDLSPTYSGSMMATGNTLMNLFVLTLPVLVSNIVTDVTDQYQWRIMLFLVAAFSFTTNAVYVAFMSTDLQPWDHQALTTGQETKEMEAVKDTKTKK